MSEINYRDMSEPELLSALGDDAQKWAEAYVQIAGDQSADVEFLTVWFANAIEHSTDLRRKRANHKFALGDLVTKTRGSNWTGHVVGFYSTNLTPIGYAVESINEPGSVQIYPEGALEVKS